MRNLVKIVMLITLAAGLSSCEKIKSIFDVEFDTTLSGDLDIDIQEAVVKSTASYDFETSAIINPLDDVDIDEYADNIRRFDVKKVLAEVIYLNKESVVFEKGTTFSISDNTDGVKWILDSDWTVTEGTQLTLSDIGELYDVVADILGRKSTFTVGAEGTCSETGVFATIRLGIDTKVIANPL